MLPALLLLLAAACQQRPAPDGPAATDADRVHTLLVNGGGQPATNYYSHLRHLEEMEDVLQAAGVPPARTTVLSSDGANPGLDLATREAATDESFWLVRGTPLESALRPPIQYVSSSLARLPLEPATRARLDAWADVATKQLRAGDTLVLFVTDHGTRNKEDDRDNRITLWGPNETLSVRELRALLDRFDPGVRVVTVMSQCYSGSFANLARTGATAGARAVCGYFSTTADRLAYGCYPENRNRDDVGHAFHFLRALRRHGDFEAAHRTTLVDDDSPDVPLRTSDAYLRDVVRTAAKAAGTPVTEFADGLLADAFADRRRWEQEIRLLDAIGHRYGIFSPRRLSEVRERLKVVPGLAGELKRHRDGWSRSCGSAATANVERFLADRPSWRARLVPADVHALPAEQRRSLTRDVLTEIDAFTQDDEDAYARLESLSDRADTSGELAYRMETRVGVLMRMRLILLRIAGMHLVETRGGGDQRRHLQELLSCESLRLPVEFSGDRAPKKDPFPSFEDDLAASETVVPGWMGVQFRPISDRQRAELALGIGPASVQAVYPDSPAKEAGLEAGDVILGPPDRRFHEPQQLREWIMTSPLGRPVPLEVMRDGKRREIALTPRAYPRVWPKLPGPPKVGSPAPALELQPYRGAPPTQLGGSGKKLLFFWATWCGVCKVALPDLEKARKRGIEVIAITDEDPKQLDAFFSSYTGKFPPLVAIDENRRAFLDYGVSGTPTFVLVDAQGRVARQSVGYRKDKGLEVLAGL
jgi:thiol-disulfide isomerase/thioredoxin